MALTKRVRDACDAVLSDLLLNLLALQKAYQAEHGTFWQGLEIGPGAPDASASPVGGHSWADVGVELPGSLLCAVRVDVYEDARGQGYAVTGTVVSEGETYRRTMNVGPDEARDTGGGWVLVPKAGVIDA